MNNNIFIYEVNRKNLIGRNGKNYISYGINCFEMENGFKMLVNQIIDISANKLRMQKFVDNLNKLNLSSTHLYDAVDDFICSSN